MSRISAVILVITFAITLGFAGASMAEDHEAEEKAPASVDAAPPAEAEEAEEAEAADTEEEVKVEEAATE